MPGPDSASQLDLISSHFGKRLRYWRLHRGHTQSELARELDIDGSYISKLESAHRRPGFDIARRCDDLLNTGGELTELVNLLGAEESTTSKSYPTATVMPGPPPSPIGNNLPPAVTAGVLMPLTRLAESFADVEASVGGQHIGESAERQAQAAIGMHIGSAVSRDLLCIAARFARTAGAIRTDFLDEAGTLYWNDCAVRWALDGGDHRLAAEMRARQAFVQADRANTSEAVALGVQAEQISVAVPAIVWGLLAQAHGLAAAGDRQATQDRLQSAEAVLRDLDGPLMAEPGIYSDAFLWHSHAGHCHLVLAENDHGYETNARKARDHLHRALSAASVHHIRDLALTRLMLARAQFCAGDYDAAATETAQAAAMARSCASPRLAEALARTYARVTTGSARIT